MKIRQLLLLLSAALVFIPAVTIGLWTYNQSINSKLQEVRERHLMIANNLGNSLERYAHDTKLIFEDISQKLIDDKITQSSTLVLRKLDFLDIAVLDQKSGETISCISIDKIYGPNSAAQLPPAPDFIKQAIKTWAKPGQTLFSPVITTPDGRNIILLIKKFGDKIAVGKLNTNYFIKIGNSVSFGKNGRALIVDSSGNILTNSRRHQETSGKNIARLEPVGELLDGRTGIVRYQSETLGESEIAGLARVENYGWGIIVTQPVSELYDQSVKSWQSYLLVVAVSSAFALLLVTWLSIRSTRPLLNLIDANRKVRNPGMRKLLELPSNWAVPSEIRQLYETHNEMVSRLHDKHSDTLRMAYSDAVTNLPTRDAFNKLARTEFLLAEDSGQEFLFIFIDLDEFKVINDTLGHGFGDRVLVEYSNHIKRAIKSNSGIDVIASPIDENGDLIQDMGQRAIVSRIGGDEFVALIPWQEEYDRVEEFLSAFSSDLAKPYKIKGKEFSTTASIGASLFDRDGTTVRELTKKADIAMYWAKNCGRGNFRLFDKSIGEKTPAEIQRDVAQAIKNDQMVLYYQPKINNLTGEANSVEAVVRWVHPKRGIISPNHFIPAINNTEVSDQLGEWVIRTACRQIRSWQQSGQQISISINIANHHLVSSNFLTNLLKITGEIGIDPRLLEIEMTEETAMTAHSAAKHVIRSLKQNGFKVSLDDYGKGYSNLARLAALEIDVIKIDYSLINGILNDSRIAIIVASALEMAKNLNCKTVAEGIETIEQAQYVSGLGCDFLQGFLFAKPMPVEELNKWFVDQTNDSVAHKAAQIA